MRIKPLFLWSVAIVMFTLAACSSATDTESIKATFHSYQKAIQENHPLVAANSLDLKTLNWYTKIVEMAQEASKSQLEKTNYLSKVTVLALRQELSKKEIQQLDAKSAFAFAIEKELYGKMRDYTIANIKTDGDRAVAIMNQDDLLTETYFKFIREDGQWKINFASMINLINDEQTGRLVQNIPAENKKAISIVAKLSEKPIKRYIWSPANRW